MALNVKLIALLVTAPILVGCFASAEMPDMTQNKSTEKCELNLNFANETEVESWFPILDGVMGGRSTGARFSENEHMTFKGMINTNGGGFSSLRRALTPGELEGAESLNLSLLQDGRAYRMTFRTNERFRGRPVSYQLAIPQTSAGEWQEITLPLKGFRTSLFGRQVSAAQFDPAEVREIGFIIADGIDGPFELNVRTIRCG